MQKEHTVEKQLYLKLNLRNKKLLTMFGKLLAGMLKFSDSGPQLLVVELSSKVNAGVSISTFNI